TVLLLQRRREDRARPLRLAAQAVQAEEEAVAGLLVAGGQEDAVAVDHWRRVAPAGDGHVPADVLGFAPGERGSGVERGAVAARPAPPGPVLGDERAGGEEEKEGGQDQAGHWQDGSGVGRKPTLALYHAPGRRRPRPGMTICGFV